MTRWRRIRARQRHHRALRRWRAGHLHRARLDVTRAVALFDGLAGSAGELAVALLTLGDFEFELARFAGAEAVQRRAVRLLEAQPSDARRDATLVHALVGLANTQRRQGTLDAAEATLHAALTVPAGDGMLCTVHTALGVVHKDAGRYAEAAEQYAAALTTAANPRQEAAVHHNLAGLAHARRRFADALEPARTALALHRRACGPSAPEVAADTAVLGAVLLGLGHLDAAEAELRQAHRSWVARYGPDHYEVAVCLHGLGVVEHRRGNPGGAERLLTEALRIKTAVLGAGHPELEALRHNLAAARAAAVS